MPLRVVFRPQAEDEALEVRQWYESRRVGLGREFGQALDVLVIRIGGSPLAFPFTTRPAGQSYRASPNAIYFRVAEDSVVVLAIHGRQHPARWQSRS